jgi:hypothetical protein
MSELEAEQLEDEEFLAKIVDADHVVSAKQAFGEVMPPLVDRLFDPTAQRRAIEFLSSPLLQEATRAFNDRWGAGHQAGDPA